MSNKKTIISLILFLLVYLLIATNFETPSVNQVINHVETNDRFLEIGGEYEKGQVLIKYKLESSTTLSFGKSEQSILDQKFKDAGVANYVKLSATNQNIGTAQLSLNTPQTEWIRAYIDKELSVLDVLANLGALPQVISAEPNYLYYTASDGEPEIVEDPLVAEQYYLNSVGVNEARAHLESLGINPGGSRDVVVAVIDTGVDYTHQDLAPNMWVNTAEIPGNGIDDDGNGFVDDIYGASTVSNEWHHTGNPMDDHGHGTHVAGIIAGKGGNGVGIRGVADNVRIMAIKASASSGIFLSSDIAEAVSYAYQNGADVINMSFGGYAKSNAVEDALAIAFSKAVLIAAAGNDAYINKPHEAGRDMFPAAYPWVVGVMASSGNTLAGFSNFDYWPEDAHEYSITAPGTFIMSTLPNNKYAKWSGTSMATPIVSGIAALLRSKFTETHHNSRFIMGQLIGTATKEIEIPSFYKLAYRVKWECYYEVSAINALTQTPKPNLSYYDYFVFDPVSIDENNNENGMIDSGELIYFGLYIRNHWGQAREVEVKLDTVGPGGVADPYITFINDTVTYGQVGSFSTEDNGFTYSDGNMVTGVENPFIIRVSPDTPNDYTVNFNVVITAKNGLDAEDETIYVKGIDPRMYFTINVRNGVELPNMIEEDMVLTNDKFYIISNATRIASGATVTVEEGTNIQFWSTKPEDPYAETPIAYLRVDGTLYLNGTAENPIKLFPSGLYDAYEVRLFSQNNGRIFMNYTEVQNPRINVSTITNSYFTQNSDIMMSKYLSEGNVWDNWVNPNVYANSIDTSIFWKLGGRSGQLSVNGYVTNSLFDSNYMRVQFDGENNVFLNNFVRDMGYYNDQLFVSSGEVYYRNTDSSISIQKIFRDEESGTTYIQVNGLSRYEYAQRFARQLGGHLVVVNNAKENDFIRRNISSQTNIGLWLSNAVDGYEWINGNPLTYKNFTPEIEGNNSFEQYVSIKTDGYWYKTNSSSYLIELTGDIYINDIVLDTEYLTLGHDSLPYQVRYELLPVTANVNDLEWYSMNENIATIDENGVVTPVALGQTTIVVRSKDQVISKSISLSVIQTVPLTGIQLSAQEQININQVYKIPYTLTPFNTTELAFNWSSSDENIATVDQQGRLTAHRPGLVTVHVENPDGTIFDEITIQVVSPVTGLRFPSDYQITFVGAEPQDMNIEITPSDATNQTVIYQSANPNVAYVDEFGFLHAVSNGMAVIRATAQHTNVYTEMTVTVTEESVANTKFIDIATIGNHDYMRFYGLTDSGEVWHWGREGYSLPERITQLTNVKEINSGYDDALFLTNDGKVYNVRPNWSGNSIQQLSLDFTNIKDVESQSYDKSNFGYVLILREDGTVWGTGNNFHGELPGVYYEQSSEYLQLDVSDVKQMLATYRASVYLKTDGKVYYSGHPNSDSIITEIAGLSNITSITRSQAWDYGYTRIIATDIYNNQYHIDFSDSFAHVYKQTFQGINEPVEQYAFTGNHYITLTESGKVYTMGYNGYGQLGVGHTSSNYSNYQLVNIQNISKIYATYYNSMALTNDGRIYVWGSNNQYHVGDLTTVNRLRPTQPLIGFTKDMQGPQITTHNISDDFNVQGDIVISFDEAIKAHTSIMSVRLVDEDNNPISIQRRVVLNQLIIDPVTPLTYGKGYSLIIPNGAVVDYFNNVNNYQMMNFETEAGINFSRTAYKLDINEGTTQINYTVNPKWTDSLVFSSNDTSIVEVDQNGVMTPKGIGVTTIEVKNPSGTYVWTLSIEVIERIHITSLEMTQDEIVINTNQTKRIFVNVLPINYNEDILWSSSDQTIATVDEFGFVKGLKDGTVTITATSLLGVHTDTVTVTVIEPVTEVKQTQKRAVAEFASGTIQLEANVLPTTATNQNIIWESANTSIATVDSTGLVTFVQPGEVVIRARAEHTQIYDDMYLVITELDVDSINFVDVKTLHYGEQLRTFALDDTGEVWHWGYGTERYAVKLGLSDIVQMESSYHSIYFLSSTGQMYSTYYYNQSFDTFNTGVSNIKQFDMIDYGYNYFLILKDDGTVWARGNNNNGELYGLTGEYIEQFTQLPGLSQIKQVLSLSQFNVYLTEDGRILYSGMNQIGEVSNVNQIVEIKKYSNDWDPGYEFIAKNSNNQHFIINLYTADGQTEVYQQDFSSVPGNVISFEKNFSHEMVLTDLGHIYTRGSNHYGSLGLGYISSSYNSTYQKVALEDVNEIFVHRRSSFAITTDGNLYIWGMNNSYSQVGNMSNQHEHTPQKLMLGYKHDQLAPQILTQNPTHFAEQVNINQTIEIQFNEKIKASNLSNIRLLNSQNQPISIDIQLTINKLLIKPVAPLKYGEAYRLDVPAYTILDHVNLPNEWFEIRFETEHGIVLDRTNFKLDINDDPMQILYQENEKWTDVLVFTSSDDAVITVDQNGVVTPISLGQAQVTISNATNTYSWTVTFEVVHRIPITSISIEEDEIFVNTQTTKRIIPVIEPYNYNEDIIWSSSDPLVASIDEFGFVTGHKDGSVTITVSTASGLLNDTITVTVIEPVTHISVEEEFIVFNLNDAPIQIPVIIGPDGATNKNVIWESASPEIAYVDELGFLQAVAKGTAIIRGTAEHTELFVEIIVTISDEISHETKFIDIQAIGSYENFRIFALTDEGHVWYWGRENAFLPQRVPNVSNISQMNMSTNRGYLLSNDGKLYEVSINGASNSVYLRNTGVDNIIDASINTYSYETELIVIDDGTVWGRGNNQRSQLGAGVFTYASNYIQIEGALNVEQVVALNQTTVMLGNDGNVYYMGNPGSKSEMTLVEGLSDIVDIKRAGLAYEGHYNVIAKNENGEFFKLAFNTSTTPTITNQSVLGLSSLLDYSEQSGYHQIALTLDGKVYAKGNNDYGQLGIGTTNNSSTYQMINLDNVVKVFAIGHNSFALTQNGDIYVWGRNNNQQIGDLSSENRLVPFKAMIGLSVDEQNPYIENQYPLNNQVNVAVDSTITIDFNEGVRAYQNYSSIQLFDQNNRQVSITKQLKLDKLYIKPVNPLRFGETYTLNVPTSSVMDYFMNTNDQTQITFTTESGVVFNRTQYRIDINDEPITLNYTINDKWHQDLIFTSMNEAVATVTSEGIITPVAIGSTEIEVTSEDGRYNWQIIVTVIERIPVTELTIVQEDFTISKGVTQRVNLAIQPSNYNEDIIWTSSDSSIATVDEFGFVRGLKNGIATITATASSGLYSDQVIVTVIEPVTNVYFRDPEVVINKNATSKQLEVIILPVTATNKEVEFVSASPEIATVTKDGLLTPVTPGVAVIRAYVKYSNLYADLIVTVTEVEVDQIKFVDVQTLGYGDYFRSYALTDTGDVWYWGRGTQTPKQMTNLNNIIRMNFSSNSGLMQKATGEIYKVTDNSTNNNIELVTTGLTNITHISMQDYNSPHSLLVRSDGTVWGEGNNSFGQLAGVPFTSVDGYVQLEGLSNVKQAIALYESSVYLTTGGKVYYSGYPNQKTSATLIPELTDIASIETFNSYNSNQRLVVAKNSLGQYFRVNLAGNAVEVTAVDSNVNNETMIQYADNDESHKLALTESGKVYAMGYNYHGQLGNNTRINSYYNYVDTGLANVSKIILARYNSYAITNEGKLYMWGLNSNNSFGNPRLPYYVTTPTNIMIGTTQPTHTPFVTSIASETGGAIKIDGQIVIDFNEAVQVQYNYANLRLYDGLGNQVSIQKIHAFDKIILQPMLPLLYGQTYTVSIPGSTVTNYFGYSNNASSHTFTTEKGVDFTRTNYRLDINDEPISIEYTLNPNWTQGLLFESMNVNVATVDANGMVTPVAMGATTIKVYTEDLKYIWYINLDVIHRIPIQSLDITDTSIVINKDQTQRVNLVVNPSDYNEDIIWTSSDPTVATVDEYGFVKGKMNGATMITATSLSGLYSDTVAVQVIEPVTEIVYSQYMVMMTIEDLPLSIDVEVLPFTATNKNVIWRSSNSNVAYFDTDGKLVPINVGTIIVRAQAEHSSVYKDIIVSITESAMAQPIIKDAVSVYYEGKTAIFAVQSDGSLWTWGQGNLGRGINEDTLTTPFKLEISGIKSIHSNNMNAWTERISVIKNDGTVWSLGEGYYTAGNGNWNSTTFEKANYINNIIDISHGYYHTLALKDDGTVWSWGNNGSYQLGDGTNQERTMPIQVNGIENAVQIMATHATSYVLTENGTLYAFGGGSNYSTPKVIELPSSMKIKELIQVPNSDQISWLTENNEIYYHYLSSSTPYRQYTTLTQNYIVNKFSQGNGFALFTNLEGKTYALGNNEKGQLGNGQNFINNGEHNPSLVDLQNISKYVVGYQNTLAITNDGRLNIWGDNTSGQLADFSKEHNFKPREVYFGAESDNIAPTRISSVPTSNETEVSIDTQIRIKYNEALRQSSNFSTIYLLDSNENIVSTQKSIDWDTLVITPTNPLEPNTTYKVQMDSNSVTDMFGNSASSYTYYFITEADNQVTSDPQIPERHYWNQAEVQSYFQAYVENGHNSTFYNNAILNNLYDVNVQHWLRFFTNEGDQTYVFSNNYWGTSDPNLVGKQIVDFNDYQQYAHIKVTPFLTEGNEMMYPFVTKVSVSNDTETDLRVVGAEPITINITFNRPMDINVPLKVFFGPDYPFTDYEVQGQWIDSRNWEGTFNITPLTGDGKQYFRIRDAVSAEDPFLWMGDDDARFMFEIKSFGAEAMNLQASGGEGSIELSWMQDEFDTLAGYNMYRSTDLNGEYSKINSVLITSDTNAYTDYNVQPGTPYFYKFTIVKTDLTESQFSNTAFAAAYDVIPPQLFHTPVITANVGQEIQISAIAMDNIGIKSAKLFYRNINETTYREVDMVLGLNNRYTGKVQASHSQVPGLAYYIEVSDGRSGVAHGSAASPNIIEIKDNPTIVTIAPNKGIYQGNTDVVISGINFKEGAKVYFSNLEGLNVIVEDENTIKAKTPAFTPGRVNVKVVNPDGSSHTLYNGFEYFNDDVKIIVNNLTVAKGSEFQVPVRIENAQGLVALDLTIGYDSTALTFVSATKSAITGRFSLAVNSSQTDKVLMSMASDTSVSGSGDIIVLKFQAKTAIAAASTQITIDTININSINDGIGLQNGTITFSTVYSFSGSVFYYFNNNVVPGVKVELRSPLAVYSGTTPMDGTYSFSGVIADDYELKATKENQLDAISAYDASLILQHVVQLTTLNTNQKIAADVNSDGAINSMDASMILQYVAGMRSIPFEGTASAWKFIYPQSNYTGLNRNYSSQNIQAILVGDVSGNYSSSSAQNQSTQGVIKAGQMINQENGLTVPVSLDYFKYDLYSFETTIEVEDGVTVGEIRLSNELQNAYYVVNKNQAGYIRIAVASATPLNLENPVIEIDLTSEVSKDKVAIRFTNTLFNEFNQIAELHNVYRYNIDFDFNQDGVIDNRDILSFIQNYNKTYQYDDISFFDINRDGVIDIYDVIAAKRFR